jgi:hypothetical protein
MLGMDMDGRMDTNSDMNPETRSKQRSFDRVRLVGVPITMLHQVG